MISSAYSVPQNLVSWTGATRGVQKCLEGTKTPLELSIRHENRWEVVGGCVYDDTMSRRSNQLLLTSENDHFEGSMLLKAKEGIMPRFGGGGGVSFLKS